MGRIGDVHQCCGYAAASASAPARVVSMIVADHQVAGLESSQRQGNFL